MDIMKKVLLVLAFFSPLSFYFFKLARKLSHVEKEVRDSGVEVVRIYLQKRPGLPHLEMMQLWKGFFF